ALGKPSPAERADFLTQACGDDAELRREVESLLQAHDRGAIVAAILEAPLPHFDDLIAAAPDEHHVGTTVGPYKLLQKIGEGGMGIVFMAEQQRPVRRMVAV